MKIFVNARFLTQPLSGVQRYGIECCLQIKKINPDAVFVAPRNIIHKEIAQRLAAKIIGRNGGHLWEQADLPFFLSGQKGAKLLNLANMAPLFYSNNYITVHDLAFYHHPEWNSKRFSAWYNIMAPRIIHNARHIFTVSETIKAEIAGAYRIPVQKISVTYNGISENMIGGNSASPSPKEKIILSVGTFNIRKNHQNLIKAFIQSDLKNDYRLTIVGDKNKVFADADLDEDVIKNNNVIILNDCSEEQLFALYRKAEIVASVSLYEGFGIPLLEGLYNGCKIVCSDIPVYRELYEKYGTFCNPLSIAEIKEALLSAAKSPVVCSPADPIFHIYNYKRSAELILENMARS